MFHLGVPTTRALSLVATGDDVVRDMFYDGHPKHEPGAIVCRVAPNFLRFGNYELPASRGETVLLRQLVDFTLASFFPQLGATSKQSCAAFLREVAQRTARLIAHWQAVGFVHGVMNTDNLSILGLTIDYGPYGWVDDFDLSWTRHHRRGTKRYCFGNQPASGCGTSSGSASRCAAARPGRTSGARRSRNNAPRGRRDASAKLGIVFAADVATRAVAAGFVGSAQGPT
jgi:uncharacterized protein YdiU (UPF0061 family)